MRKRKYYRLLIVYGTCLFCISSVYAVLRMSEHMQQQTTVMVFER